MFPALSLASLLANMKSEIPQEALDAIEILTGKSAGDIFYAIEGGNFEKIAIEALTAFIKKYYLLDRKDDSEPVDDLQILKNCLEELQDEYNEVKSHPFCDSSKIRELVKDIDDLKERIRIAQS